MEDRITKQRLSATEEENYGQDSHRKPQCQLRISEESFFPQLDSLKVLVSNTFRRFNDVLRTSENKLTVVYSIFFSKLDSIVFNNW